MEDMQFDDETYTITGGPLRPHEYVIVKSEMTAADKAWITNRSARTGGNAKNPKVDLTIGDVDLATLERMIVAWNRTKEDKSTGKQVPIPLTVDNIGKMSERLSTFVKKWIDYLNPDTEELDKDFLPPANGTSKTNS